MRRKLPSLSALEAFEAVARLGSTSKASEELGRTQSAVSRQILNLEAFVERPLFERRQNKLVLNGAGDYLFESIVRSLDRIEYVVSKTAQFGAGGHKISLRVWPTFGARWLTSRLAKLPASELGIDVNVSIGVRQTEALRSPDVDAIILYGSGDWPDMTAYLLVPEELIAVASPQLVERLGTDISAYEWLTLEPRPDAWDQWVKARADPGTPIKSSAKHQVSLLTELACLGLGAAVLPRLYVERELDGGRLAAPFGEPLLTGRGYYLCYHRENDNRPQFIAFRDWLLSTC
jgi:LysR family glycine cleavage system transcriptional activator